MQTPPTAERVKVTQDLLPAFEEFYRAEYSRVVGTAFLLTRDREEALDLAQETFARAYSRWGKVSRHPAPGAWLQKVVTNLAMSWHRGRWRRESFVALEPASVDVEILDPAILAALGELPMQQRAVVVLRFFADMSVEQVADALGKRPGTVKALTSQGLQGLRQQRAVGRRD